ncbi:hypothetical protein ACFS3C_12350 [Azotobacter vinelandii]
MLNALDLHSFFVKNLNNNNLTIQKDLKCMLSQVNMRAVGGGIPELTWRDAVRLIVTLAFFYSATPRSIQGSSKLYISMCEARVIVDTRINLLMLALSAGMMSIDEGESVVYADNLVRAIDKTWLNKKIKIQSCSSCTRRK